MASKIASKYQSPEGRKKVLQVFMHCALGIAMMALAGARICYPSLPLPDMLAAAFAFWTMTWVACGALAWAFVVFMPPILFKLHDLKMLFLSMLLGPVCIYLTIGIIYEIDP